MARCPRECCFILSIENESDLFCLYLPLINQHLKKFQDAWNQQLFVAYSPESSNDDRSIDTQTYGLEQNTSEEDERDAVDIPRIQSPLTSQSLSTLQSLIATSRESPVWTYITITAFAKNH